MFIYPNKPIRVQTLDTFLSLANDGLWVLQAKHDGDRALIEVDKDGVVTIYSRHNRVHADSAPWRHIADLPLARPFLLDGELVNKKLIIIWDYGVLAGKMVVSLPYAQRLQRILTLPDLSSIHGYTIKTVSSAAAQRKSVERLLSGGERVEGLVAKRLDAVDFWGISRTTEVPSMLKWRIKG